MLGEPERLNECQASGGATEPVLGLARDQETGGLVFCVHCMYDYAVLAASTPAIASQSAWLVEWPVPAGV